MSSSKDNKDERGDKLGMKEDESWQRRGNQHLAKEAETEVPAEKEMGSWIFLQDERKTYSDTPGLEGKAKAHESNTRKNLPKFLTQNG